MAEHAHGAVGRGDCDVQFITQHRACGQCDLGLQAVGQFDGVDAGCGVDGFSQHHGRNSNGFVRAVGFLTWCLGINGKAGTQLGGGTEAVGHADLHDLCAIRQAVHIGRGNGQAEGVARLDLGGVVLTSQRERDRRAHLRVGAARHHQRLAAFGGVDAAVDRDGVKCQCGWCALDLQFVAADVNLGHAASHHGDRHVVGTVCQRGEAADQAGVQAPGLVGGAVNQACRQAADAACDRLSAQIDRYLVAAGQSNEVAGHGGVGPHRDELGRLAREHGSGCISLALQCAVCEQVVHRGHIGVCGVDEQAEAFFCRGVARHIADLHVRSIGVAVVEGDGVGCGQRDGPGVAAQGGLHQGGVGHVVQRDLNRLSCLGVGGAPNDHRRSHTGEHRAALGRIKLACGVVGQ